MQKQEEAVQSAQEQTPSVLTQAIVTAKFNRELTLIKFQAHLQSFINWEVTQDNIPESQQKMKEARALITNLKNIKAKLKKPALDECDMWEAAFKSFLDPLEKAMANKDKTLQEESRKAAEEDKKRKDEQDRIDRINKDIDNFLLVQSNLIANATNVGQLVAIEKVIGSHKANKSRYEEFLPNLIEKCNELTPLIRKQKENIKALDKLKKETDEAEKTQDDGKLIELLDKKEEIENSIEEKKIQIQETAIDFATRPDDVVTPRPVFTNVAPRRRAWEFEVVDEKKAFNAGMLVTELNKEKVKAKLAEIKDSMEGTEIVVDGIKYSYKATY